jgi:type 1 glutamine amidotransferase
MAQPKKKQLLFIGMSNGWNHESVSDAMATIYQLGRQTGLWETTLRTDVALLTKKKLDSNARNLDFFDAIMFMTTGELPLDESQKADLLSFVKNDGKGFLGAHNATDTFYKWPEYGEMIGGWFDAHPWGTFDATVKVDNTHPATSHFPQTLQIRDEIYQTKNFSPERWHVLMKLDTSRVDMTVKNVRFKEIPITWAGSYGKGRVFYSGLGHLPEVWDRPDIRKMWEEAIKWVTR